MEVDGTPNLGGMEKAFSMNVMMRLNEFFSGSLIVDMFGRAAPTSKQRKRKKTCRRSGNKGVWGPGDILPNEFLVSVLMKLSIFDYFAFSGVCKLWRSVCIDIRKQYMQRQQPLLVIIPRYSKKACVLYNMFDGKSCKAMLPNFPAKNLVGLSSGYLTTMDRNTGFSLVNLMTRHELRFPVYSKSMGDFYYFTASYVLFQSTQLSKVFMVLFPKDHNFLLLSESGASSWQKYRLPNNIAWISDVKIFDGKIFVLTCDARFGEFNPRADPVVKLYNVNIPIQLSPNLHFQLVTSDKKLYAIVSDYLPHSMSIQYLSFFELDYKTESVKQIHDLGSKSLFLSPVNAAVVDTAGWGAGNCVCVLHSVSLNRFSFFHLNGNELATAPIYWEGYLKPYFWYFPDESWDISCVGDDFGT